MKTAELICHIIDGFEKLVINIRKLYINIKSKLNTKKNITI